MIQGAQGAQGRPWPPSHDARYPGSVKVEYLFHPLFGQQLPVVRYNTSGKQPQLVLQTDEGLRFVPQWMTDPLQCARLTCGHIPQCSWHALLQLEMLLDGLDSQNQTAT